MSDTYLKVGKKSVRLKTVSGILIGFVLVLSGIWMGYLIRDKEASGADLKLLRAWGSQTEKVRLERNDLDFSMYWQVWDTLEQNFLETEKIDSKKMIYGSIQGMTSALGDPYTVFLPPTDNQQMKEDLNGEFDGIGVQLGYKHDTLAVMAPLEEHPAIKQGIKAGDLIVNIKDEAKGVDKDSAGMTLPEAVSLIRGKKGTPVTLTLYREGKGTFEVTVVRDTILIPSVELVFGNVENNTWQKNDNGKVAWLKLRRFGDNTQKEWDTAIDSIQARRKDLTGVILDVRNNPGGYLNGAVSLASDFIPEGVIVKQQGKRETQVFNVSHRARLLDLPVVVLINGGSASAAEILAGALRDRVGAKLVGEKSFGKGTVQEAMDLNGNAGLHVTTARWLLPNGDWIHEEGLKPDVEVVPPEDATESGSLQDTQLLEGIKNLTSAKKQG